MALNTDSDSSFGKSTLSSTMEDAQGFTDKESVEAVSVKFRSEAPPVEKKGVLILSKLLHSLFVKYLRSGRIRAPQSSELCDLMQTFKSGAKRDRRALQSKFKSWSKRMVLREADQALLLASSGKLIIPLEECDTVVLPIHLSRVNSHLTVDEVATEIKKHYTWTRKDFGMDWDIVVDAIKNGCKNTTCQMMCDLYYKGQTISVRQENHRTLPDCSAEGNFSQERNRTAEVLTGVNNPSISCNTNNTPVREASKAESVSSSESSSAKNGQHSGPLSGVQIIPIPAVSADALKTAPSHQAFQTGKPCVQPSAVRFYIPCKPAATVTASHLLLSKEYSQIFSKAKPLVSERPFQLVKKLDTIPDITIRPLEPQVSSLTAGKSVLWKTFLGNNLRTYSKKNVAPPQNEESAASPREENETLRRKETDDLSQKGTEYDPQRLIVISEKTKPGEQNSHLGIKITPLECATIRKTKSQAVQTSPPKNITKRRKLLPQQPINDRKKKFKQEADNIFSKTKEGGPKKSMYFIISRKKTQFKKKEESLYFRTANTDRVALPDKSSVTFLSNGKETEVTAPHYGVLNSNSNRKKQPRKSTPRKSVMIAEDRTFSCDYKEMMSSVRKSEKEQGNSCVPGSNTTREIKKDRVQNSVEPDVRKCQKTVDKDRNPSFPENEEPIDVTMEKIVEHAVTMKSSFRQMLANEGRGKSLDVLKSKIIACERLVKKLKSNPEIANSSNEGFLSSNENSILSSVMKMAWKEG